MINAAITPGTQPNRVRMNTMVNDPQPRSTTAKGGKMSANKTCKQVICFLLKILIGCKGTTNFAYMQAFGDFFLRKGAIYRVLKVPERQSGACSRIAAQGPLRIDLSLFSQKKSPPLSIYPAKCERTFGGPLLF